jgi:hypothetical protein
LGYGAVHDYLAEGQHQRHSSGSTLSVIRRLTELLTLDRSNARTRGKTQIARKAFINVYIVVDCDLQVTAGHPSEPQIGVVVRAARSESTARGEIVLGAFLESSIILTAERVERIRRGLETEPLAVTRRSDDERPIAERPPITRQPAAVLSEEPLMQEVKMTENPQEYPVENYPADCPTTPPEEYKVGRGKPPKHTQFPKDRSGNPKGRPKGSRNYDQIKLSVYNQLVTVIENGRKRKVTAYEAALMKVREMALSGNLAAFKIMDEDMKKIPPKDDKRGGLNFIVEYCIHEECKEAARAAREVAERQDSALH